MPARQKTDDGRRRVVIESVWPEIDAGRFPIARAVGEEVQVEADAFTDGHDVIRVLLRHRRVGDRRWNEAPMAALVNDRYRGAFVVGDVGRHAYTVAAAVDHFAGWRRDVQKKIDAGQDVAVDLLIGADLAAEGAGRAEADRAPEDAERLRAWEATLRGDTTAALARLAADAELRELMVRHPDRSYETELGRTLEVVVDPPRARFSAWYELFPRSLGRDGAHGTLRDVEAFLPRVAEMGFDVLYLPPVHPIGRDHRKGRNNAVVAEADDVGSPWAIGAAEGGHTAVLPELGSVADIGRLAESARALGIELALDIAFQCAPDHPWVREHPEWFRRRPDGTIQYAENPPKKYQDIYPFDFETDAWRELWAALKGVVDFWIEQGVRVFRVDNPHTKPFPFWEWLIGDVKATHPEVIFLSEAFTRPKVMYRLAKLGFSQSYTYFAWRTTAWELREYLSELTDPNGVPSQVFRPNLWPNTPDILTETLQTGGRPAFVARLVLAATLGASYGVYGPPYEVMEGRNREAGSEEYLDSEKYQLRDWGLDGPETLRELMTVLNRIRRENPPLHSDRTLRFHGVDNDQLLVYSKTAEGANPILVVASVDHWNTQGGWTSLDLGALGLDADTPYQVHDLLGGGRYVWHGAHNYVELNPHVLPAHVFRVRRHVRSEHDFDYFA